MKRLARHCEGASAAEFALVLPLLLLLIFGVIDVGRYLWAVNQAEKAAQMGIRYAVVTDNVLGSDFADYSFSIEDSVPQGSAVPTADFDRATCTATSCSCDGGGVCSVVSFDSTAFAAIVARMQAMYPAIQPANVVIEYRNIGLGFAGDPNGPDVAPLVTVRLTGLAFQPISTLLIGASLGMPDYRASLTAEDSSGDVAN